MYYKFIRLLRSVPFDFDFISIFHLTRKASYEVIYSKWNGSTSDEEEDELKLMDLIKVDGKKCQFHIPTAVDKRMHCIKF